LLKTGFLLAGKGAENTEEKMQAVLYGYKMLELRIIYIYNAIILHGLFITCIVPNSLIKNLGKF
jgi:hypothetical protein